MKHVMKLHDAPYHSIKNGSKTIELRLNDEKRKAIAVGDEIEFIHSDNPDLSLRCMVIALHKFPSFKELYAHLPLLKCGYTERDILSASPNDMNYYYSKEEQAACGVLGIEFKLYSNQ